MVFDFKRLGVLSWPEALPCTTPPSKSCAGEFRGEPVVTLSCGSYEDLEAVGKKCIAMKMVAMNI
jgi:hypothetical protein